MPNNSKPRGKLNIVLICIFIVFIIISLTIFGYMYLNREEKKEPTPTVPKEDKVDEKDKIPKEDKEEKKINIAIFGVDVEGIRTDVILVGNYNTVSKKINLISVPRDTRIVLDNELHKQLQSFNSHYVPEAIKINELYAYAGKKRNQYSTNALEELLDIKIDNFVKVDLKGFKKIVDIIGGVEMDVPYSMKYKDPAQNLYINVNKGKQVLNGNLAEQIVRYRKDNYGNEIGDIGRIQMQQAFLKALLKQMLKFENILKLNQLISAAFEYVETDLSLSDILSYAKYINDINLDNLKSYILPGTSRYISSKSFFILDKPKTKLLVDEVIYNKQPIEKVSLNKKIEILNGSKVAGIASRTAETLREAGYNIVKIGSYSDKRIGTTRIIVNDNKVGNDLSQYFNEAEISYQPIELPDGIDIQIIIGLNEE